MSSSSGKKQASKASALSSDVAAIYTYDDRRYRSDVLIPGYGSILFVAVAVLLVFSLDRFAEMAALILVGSVIIFIAGIYSIQRTFFAHAYPRTVEIDDKTISFESFGRRDTYEIAKLTRCSVREASSYNTLVRIADKTDSRGRYFLTIRDMHDADGGSADSLLQFLYAQEERLDPDSLRVRARRADAHQEDEKTEEPKQTTKKRKRKKKK